MVSCLEPATVLARNGQVGGGGDALAVTVTADGALRRYGFQKLEGHATAEGLWLESSANGAGRFQVFAISLRREDDLPAQR